MKKILILTLLTMLPIVASADDAVEVDGIYYNLIPKARAAEVTSNPEVYGYYSGAVNIPASFTYDGKEFSVTSIGNDAFHGCSGLTYITIPSSVNSIGDYAFGECNGLLSIIIPSSVTRIGDGSFAACISLDTLTIPNSVTSIGNSAFGVCESLTSVIIGNNVTTIGQEAFSGCSGLTSINIPNSVTNIGWRTFAGCTSLTSIKVEEGNTAYDSRNNCNAIIESATNTLIAGCTSTIIPNSVTSIGVSAFECCRGLTSINIPNSVTSIGSSAFKYCPGLNSITIPNSVTSIDENVFYGCEGLTSVNIPNSVISIGENAFYGCIGLTSVIIPNSVTNINNRAFSGCTNLNSFTIGNSLTNIGLAVFYGCKSLTEVYCYAEKVPSANFYAFDRKLITSAKLYVPIASVSAYKSIEPWSIFGTILSLDGEGDNIVCIEGIYYKFYPNYAEVTYKNTDYNSYSGIVIIPETVTYNGKTYSVTSIGEKAFLNCSGLTSITIPRSVTHINDYAFSGCNGLKKVVVPDIAAWCGIDFEDEANPLVYARHLYSNTYTEIKKLVIPNTVTRISPFAFMGCSSLTSVTIPNSVTRIGKTAFAFCSGLTSFTIPDNVTQIYDATFYGCTGLTSITIPNSVTSIGEGVFFGCIGLTSFIIPNSVTSIGSWAFSQCSNLKSVNIPSSVTTIGEYTFSGCTGLIEVYCYAKNVPSTPNNVFESSPITSATLYVPAGSIEQYKATSPWNRFGKIIAIEPELKKCAMPTISYANGELMFNCETEDVQFFSKIKDDDIKSYNSDKIELGVTYTITVYATKTGYIDSDVATATLCWIDVEPKTEGITDEDAVTEVKAVPVLVQTQGSNITIQGAVEGTSIDIYSVDGKKYGSADAEEGRTAIATSLQPGSVAIVKIGEKAVKVLLK